MDTEIVGVVISFGEQVLPRIAIYSTSDGVVPSSCRFVLLLISNEVS